MRTEIEEDMLKLIGKQPLAAGQIFERLQRSWGYLNRRMMERVLAELVKDGKVTREESPRSPHAGYVLARMGAHRHADGTV